MMTIPTRKCKRIFFLLVVSILVSVVVIAWRLRTPQDRRFHSKYAYRKNQDEHTDRHGIQVVVGHYVGNPVNKIPNATYDMINANNFKPDPRAGKNGNPVVMQPKDLLLMQQLFQINRFNVMASDRIPLNRTLPDFRRKKCESLYKDYSTYPTTSVIIVFHNEAWSTLLRTVWSVISRSPPELLQEIILVDDASEREFLKRPLDEYVATLPVPTKVLRSGERIGLIKARLRGARAARGAVLTFLDAHCECTRGWLVALLAVIKRDRRTAACPVIDIINDETFAYVKSFELHWGAFNWNLQFRWFTLAGDQLALRKNDATEPFNTPTMAGGLFAIDRRFFFEMGAYDEGMNIWGGENLEMSFRLWQCGGRIQIAPCSRVGHLFRKSSPYSFPGGIGRTLFANLARVALVWMDEWGNFYFRFNGEAAAVRDAQNVTARLELRRRLGCRDFSWYLDTVWPQHFFPAEDRFFGRIKNVQQNKCLIKPERKSLSNQPMGLAMLEKCVGNNVTLEMFVITPDGFVMTDDSICLDAPEKVVVGPSKVRIMACTGHTRQKWEYDTVKSEIRHITNQKCLDLSDSDKFTEGLIITDCDGGESQRWTLETVPWK